jgi:hypothetical protein
MSRGKPAVTESSIAESSALPTAIALLVAAWDRLPGRYLRVVTLEDKITIHNAFYDRGFQP